jgi:hypothetical protein
MATEPTDTDPLREVWNEMEPWLKNGWIVEGADETDSEFIWRCLNAIIAHAHQQGWDREQEDKGA